MNNLGLMDGIIFPITENGAKTMYVTNAPIVIISKSFDHSSNAKEFCEIIGEEGFQINKYRSGVEINFDEIQMMRR